MEKISHHPQQLSGLSSPARDPVWWGTSASLTSDQWGTILDVPNSGTESTRDQSMWTKCASGGNGLDHHGKVLRPPTLKDLKHLEIEVDRIVQQEVGFKYGGERMANGAYGGERVSNGAPNHVAEWIAKIFYSQFAMFIYYLPQFANWVIQLDGKNQPLTMLQDLRVIHLRSLCEMFQHWA